MIINEYMCFMAIAEEGHVFLCHADILFPPYSAVYLMKLGDGPSVHMSNVSHAENKHTPTRTHIHTRQKQIYYQNHCPAYFAIYSYQPFQTLIP